MKNHKNIYILILIFFIFQISCSINSNDFLKDDSEIIFNQFNTYEKESFGFAISSDPHFFGKNSNLEASIHILQLLEKYFVESKINALFILGDFFDIGGIKQNWERFIELKNKYAPSLPIYSVIGNHDKYLFGQIYWQKLFGKIENQFLIYGPTPFVWHYNINKIHFIGLNLPSGYFNMSNKEKEWVKKQINQISNDDFLIILSHSFFYSSGYKDLSGNWFDNVGNIKNISPLFIEKADLVISGHNHYMEWIEQDGINWVIIGSMGGKPDPFPSFMTKGSKWFNRGSYGFLLIEIKNETIYCSFLDEYGNLLFIKK